MPDGSKPDLDLINEARFFIKALPVSKEYFKELSAAAGAPNTFDSIHSIPKQELQIIFNHLNRIILFTMFNLSCELRTAPVFEM